METLFWPYPFPSTPRRQIFSNQTVNYQLYFIAYYLANFYKVIKQKIMWIVDTSRINHFIWFSLHPKKKKKKTTNLLPFSHIIYGDFWRKKTHVIYLLFLISGIRKSAHNHQCEINIQYTLSLKKGTVINIVARIIQTIVNCRYGAHTFQLATLLD